MKSHIKGLLTVALCLNLTAVLAQPGGPGGMGGGPRGGPRISAAMTKLFGKNNEFSANIESEVRLAQGRTMSMPGKIAFDSGKSRFDMDMSEAKGTAMPPQMAAQMKTMGMDKTVSISRPDLKTTYIVFPGLKAYAVSPEQAPADAKAGEESKVETTDLGKETVDGHPCVKKKAVVTDADGTKHESTIWTATDLKDFPVKIETTESGNAITMNFKDVKLSKPEASQFEPPADFKKYDSYMALMQEEMMKRMQQQGGGMGMPMPPGHP